MSVRIEALGDGALLIDLGEGIDAARNAQAIAIAHALQDAHWPGVLDIAPAYASVCVRYDPAAWQTPTQNAFAAIRARVSALLHDAVTTATPTATPALEIAVRYGGAFGPDLDAVAQHAGVDAEQIIARHCGAEYRVAMLGFAPGFAYLLGLDPALHMPRRASPRIRVPAGSVAIGGAQTGIYPRACPGGWQIIGRTECTLFDPRREPAALLAPGMRVKFVAT
jgi:KipI family sensor histidine kinase inhibitor